DIDPGFPNVEKKILAETDRGRGGGGAVAPGIIVILSILIPAGANEAELAFFCRHGQPIILVPDMTGQSEARVEAELLAHFEGFKGGGWAIFPPVMFAVLPAIAVHRCAAIASRQFEADGVSRRGLGPDDTLIDPCSQNRDFVGGQLRAFA